MGNLRTVKAIRFPCNFVISFLGITQLFDFYKKLKVLLTLSDRKKGNFIVMPKALGNYKWEYFSPVQLSKIQYPKLSF